MKESKPVGNPIKIEGVIDLDSFFGFIYVEIKATPENKNTIGCSALKRINKSYREMENIYGLEYFCGRHIGGCYPQLILLKA